MNAGGAATPRVRTSLDAAVRRYFPPPTDACPTFVEDTEWRTLVDGERYLPELGAQLRRAHAGDAVLIAGLELDPALDLSGRRPGQRGYEPLGGTLAGLAAAGVDVHIVLASRVLAASVPGAVTGGFRATARHAENLRRWRVGEAAPLAGRVLLDHSGALLGSNHQKAVSLRIAGRPIAFVGGIDLVTDRFDAGPHDRLQLHGRRWGWHDAAVRLRGGAAGQVQAALRTRWIEAVALPPAHYLRKPPRRALLNPDPPAAPPAPAQSSPAVPGPGTAVRVLRSVHRYKIDSFVPSRRVPWQTQPAGVHEVFATLVHAIGAARRYVYVEDQYLSEAPGGDPAYELFPALRAAAARGVKVVLVGSGVRDPEDAGVHVRPINRTLNRDLLRMLDGLPAALHSNVALFRVEHLTVHSKIVLVDDVFASIGSANIFSRSMVGTDCELSAAVVTTTGLVRDLRVALWAEHLRIGPVASVRAALADLDDALGCWRPEWATARDPLRWRTPDRPPGFRPAERVLRLVGP